MRPSGHVFLLSSQGGPERSDMVSFLLSHGADVNCDVEVCTCHPVWLLKLTALAYQSVQGCKVDTLQVVLQLQLLHAILAPLVQRAVMQASPLCTQGSTPLKQACQATCHPN